LKSKVEGAKTRNEKDYELEREEDIPYQGGYRL
jgi:hypothetical protein